MATRSSYSLDDPFGLNTGGGGGVPGAPVSTAPNAAVPRRNPYQLTPAGGTSTIPPTSVPMSPTDLANGGGYGAPTDQLDPTNASANVYGDLGSTPASAAQTGNGASGYSSTTPGATQVVNNPANAAGRGVPAQQYFQDFVNNFGLNAKQSNPTSLQPLVDAMRTEGYNATLAAPSSGGYVKGIMLDGQFVKVLDGQDNLIWQPGGDNAETGSGGGAGLDLSGLGAGNSLGTDPNGSQFDSALSSLVSGGGVTPFGGSVQKSLLDIIGKGGVAPSTDADLIAAREQEAASEQQMMTDARAQLADQGTLSVPGVSQGPSDAAVANVARQIAPSYSGAVADIEKNAATLKQQSLTSALTAATGMSEANANAMLSAIGTGTQRTTALANISLSLLRDNIDWNSFLASNGLSQAQLEAEIQNNNNNFVLGVLNAYVNGGQTLNQGFI